MVFASVPSLDRSCPRPPGQGFKRYHAWFRRHQRGNVDIIYECDASFASNRGINDCWAVWSSHSRSDHVGDGAAFELCQVSWSPKAFGWRRQHTSMLVGACCLGKCNSKLN
jgi:hypothetical protein